MQAETLLPADQYPQVAESTQVAESRLEEIFGQADIFILVATSRPAVIHTLAEIFTPEEISMREAQYIPAGTSLLEAISPRACITTKTCNSSINPSQLFEREWEGLIFALASAY